MIGLPLRVPVDPDAGPARQWIIAELSKPEYRAAQPTWFDRLSSAFADWLSGLRLQSDGISQGPILLAVAAIVIAGIVAAYFVFGPPRLNRRSAIGVLFGEDDTRDAAAMRRAAADAAGRSDYTVAIQEMFRSIARGLAERTVVTTSPGTTALGFATRAAVAFPTMADRLAAAATSFDRVRYLGATGTPDDYRVIAGLEAELRATRPELVAAP
jgi:hypothetical protein